MAKINPKIATFCPGCHNILVLPKAPQLIIKEEKKEPVKKIKIIGGKTKKPKNTLF